jgi:hypothetical protein
MRNYLYGASTILELFPSDKNENKIQAISQSDEEALSKDWEAVGNDIREAIKKRG